MANILKKNSKGYGYNYTDLNSIIEWLDSQGIEMYQTIEVIDGHDYIKTHLKYTDGTVVERLGSRVADTKMLGGKENAPQARGACETYARRYSLLMTLGLGTDDDDAACCNVEFPKTEDEMREALKKMVDSDSSKKAAMPILKKKLGLDKQVKEMTYDELKLLYQTLLG